MEQKFTKFMANFCLCSIKKLSQKWIKNSPNLWQTFHLCNIRKNSPRNGAKFTKFMANFCLCSIKNSPKNGAKIQQIYGKHNIFFTWVYMIFKYSKQFRFAPSFNYEILPRKIWLIYKVAMAFWINIYECQPSPRYGLL
jgi:hypothetical protein